MVGLKGDRRCLNGIVFFHANKRGGKMTQEQMVEMVKHLTEKLTEAEIVSAFIGVLYGICNYEVEEVKELINHFEEEAKKIKG